MAVACELAANLHLEGVPGVVVDDDAQRCAFL